MKHTDDNSGRTINETDLEESDSIFETVSEFNPSKRDRLSQYLDRTFLAWMRIAWSDWRSRFGLIIVFGYVLAGTLGLLLIEPTGPNDGPIMLKPFIDLDYFLGTGPIGQDLFVQTIYATNPILEMVIAGSVFSTIVATVVGTVSGYKAGLLDRLLSTVTDIFITIPGLPLVIVLAVVFEPRQPWVVGIILTVNAWAGLARTVRAQVLSLREMAYVEAARIQGLSTISIIYTDILPNLMPYIMINFVQSGRRVIFASVGLYFLGILPFSNVNWGVMMNTAYRQSGALYSWDNFYLLFVPMLALLIFTLGLVLLSQGLDKLFNPRVRARHAKTIGDDQSPP